MRYIETSPSSIKRNSFLPSSILMEERLDLSMLDQEAKGFGTSLHHYQCPFPIRYLRKEKEFMTMPVTLHRTATTLLHTCCSWHHRLLFSSFIILLLKGPDWALSSPNCFLDMKLEPSFLRRLTEFRAKKKKNPLTYFHDSPFLNVCCSF